AACGDDEQAAAPPPAAMSEAAIGHYCGMALADHPGPKGQVQTRSRKEPYWFSSARDTLAFAMLPEEPKDIAAMYVTAMDKATDWAKPGPDTWVAARTAFYVVGSDAKGGMGQAEIVPFSSREAAQAFADQHGGNVVPFDQVPRDAVLGGDTPAAQHPGGHK
ncbi:MAG TPA: nitrous oxide reductase accessory protein NosL, partial [Candidatus Omnitrophota bacterium]|nr:nitrous oxide reductase accessory protein NosL [Candidatus Omnitrophota bacterium]